MCQGKNRESVTRSVRWKFFWPAGLWKIFKKPKRPQAALKMVTSTITKLRSGSAGRVKDRGLTNEIQKDILDCRLNSLTEF